ncbi:RimJ/RimL family protein N-acetyltransferase [Rhizobium subbaraonis]|uniref:RimJ/RimL family protein N-acetyltransferase n=1 Tax=Rhizobium subbaraonis TaxID=908946 RepID=A0A285UAX9_9HYPH|nr:GNAT family N-acetyltransferase [Rhizobium subbaraonis]SOC37481.1 RimJ/RimL family protein N-acetyltransferase [Rhizobium subbaraonis]
MSALRLEREDHIVGDPGAVPAIATARLTLRPHRLADAPAIAESLSDFRVSRMLARVPAPFDRQDAEEWLAGVTSGLVPGWALAITTGDDVHIGTVFFEERAGSWHLGYWLNRFYWARGYMSEAVQAATARFLMRMPGVEIRSGVFADNPASLKVQERIGFRIIGLSEIYSVARSAMVPHVETLLSPGDFRPAASRR